MAILITTPADLIGAIPGMLGFRPEESIIIAGFRDERLIMAARTDLDGFTPATLTPIIGAMRQSGISSAVVIGITEAKIATCTDRAAVARADLDDAGFTVTATLIATGVTGGDTWRQIDGNDSGFVTDYRDSAVSAQVAYQGKQVGSSRQDLVDQITALADEYTGEIITEVSTVLAELDAMIDGTPVDEPRLSASLAALAANGKYRDQVLYRALNDDVNAVASAALRLARHQRGTDRNYLLTVTAAAFYIAGDGTLAGIALDEGGDRTAMGHLLATALSAGVPPESMRQTFQAARDRDDDA